MRKSPGLFLLLLVIAVLAIQCQKELKNNDQNIAILPGTMINASVSGRVLNELNEPVKGAVVKTATGTTVTDINGMFTLTNVAMSENAAMIIIEKPGYFKGIKTFSARSGQLHYIEMQLVQKTVSGEISGLNGGVINLSNGSSATFPASAFVVKGSTTAYTGNVKVAMQYIDPSSAAFSKQLQGDLRGLDATGKEQVLSNFGIIAVELSGAGGESLQLAPGKKASLRFSIPAAFQSTAPASIKLYSLDEESGMWKEEGVAAKTGNTYTTEVSHFSFWGVNVPSNTVQFTASFKDQNGNPLAYHLVRTILPQYPSAQSYGYTDSSGFIRGNIVENRQVMLEVMMNASCTTTVHSQSLGPLPAGSIALGTIQVTVPSMYSYTLSGNAINCSGQPVQDGYIEIATGIQIIRSQLTNGSFSVSFNHCSGSQPVKYIIADNGAGQQTLQTTVTLNAGNNNIGTVAACGLSMQQFISLKVDGITYMLVAPADSMKAYCYPAFASAPDVTYININSLNTAGTTTVDLALKNPLSVTPAGPNYAIYPTPLVKLAGRTDTLERMPGRPVPLSITELGVNGEYISGTISDTLWSAGLTVPHPYQLNFRVKRKD